MSAIRSRRRCGNWSPGTAPPATSPGPTARRRPSGDGRHMKVAVVGGGSTYTPELVDGMARLAGRVGVSELMLVDPDSARLDVVGPFSARIMRAAGHPAQVRWTTALDEGLDGAGAVL